MVDRAPVARLLAPGVARLDRSAPGCGAAWHAAWGQTKVCPRGQTDEVDAMADPRGRLAACSSHSGRHSRQPARKIAIGFGEPTTPFPGGQNRSTTSTAPLPRLA